MYDNYTILVTLGGARGGLVLSNVTLTDLSSIPGEISKAAAINSDADKKAALKGAIVYNMGVSIGAGSNIPAGIYVWSGYHWTPDGSCTPIITPSPLPAITVHSSAEYADLAITAYGCPPLTYTWYKNAEASTTDGTPVDNSPDAMTFRTPTGLTEGIYYYYCTVESSSSNAVATSDLFTVTVCLPPAQPSTISGSASVCSGNNESYSVDDVPGVTYTWSVPSGWGAISGQGSNSITVTAGSTGGDIIVTPSNSCGEGTAHTLVVTAVSTVPTQPGTISGTNPTPGTTGLIYSVTNVPGVTYTWSVPSGWSITAGEDTNSVTVTAGASAVSGNISVTPSNSCGNGTARTRAITVLTPCPGYPGYLITDGAYDGPTTSELNGLGTTMSQLTGSYGFAVSGDLCLAQADQSSSLHAWKDAKCSDLGNGWRLPNIAELGNLQSSRASYGMALAYWSSTEESNTYAWYWSYTNSYASYTGKTSIAYRVRCVRSLEPI
jgi:hypothetical protein